VRAVPRFQFTCQRLQAGVVINQNEHGLRHDGHLMPRLRVTAHKQQTTGTELTSNARLGRESILGQHLVARGPAFEVSLRRTSMRLYDQPNSSRGFSAPNSDYGR
jgi:hypothetical protein